MKGTRGLTLIELVVAMALFSLVAVMGMQTLNGTIRTRDALGGRDDRDRALAVTLALLRSDLDRAAPMVFHAPDGPPQSALTFDGSVLALTVSALDGTTAPFQRVEWRYDRATGGLSRASWPVSAPASAAQRNPDRVFLTGVESVRLRSYWEVQGWVEGAGAGLVGPAADAPDALDEDRTFARVANLYSDVLPSAVELTFNLDGLGEIRLLEALP
ncbi:MULTISPECIES: type II secretion system protein GspJ [Mameliella]|uniref:type II secretion system protein GspJ n=1 Tax=Mameliella TaxID=1434019 RepID=UPI000B531E8C|nr:MULTISPECIES: type II secretion system protein GspJ [Mameliella]MCR9272934.1 prepilin-type N-terminal cleavage/methylation domain-containing protein [Paracoccaceae bacterium]OWV57613.1 hypothetical protein CDZ98_15895 [Mameliella alba]